MLISGDTIQARTIFLFGAGRNMPAFQTSPPRPSTAEYVPIMEAARRSQLYQGWKDAVNQALPNK